MVPQLVRPGMVVQELIETIFRIKSVLDTMIFVVVFATLLAVTVVFILSWRLREKELLTIFRLGCSRGAMAWFVMAEIVLIALASVILCGVFLVWCHIFSRIPHGMDCVIRAVHRNSTHCLELTTTITYGVKLSITDGSSRPYENGGLIGHLFVLPKHVLLHHSKTQSGFGWRIDDEKVGMGRVSKPPRRIYQFAWPCLLLP